MDTPDNVKAIIRADSNVWNDFFFWMVWAGGAVIWGMILCVFAYTEPPKTGGISLLRGLRASPNQSL